MGELVSFGTAICWTMGAVFFEQGIKRIGVLSVNFFKLVFAVVLLTITAGFMRGMPIPVDAPMRAVIYLPISGIVGLVIADTFLFSAYATVGPRVSMLFMALCPPITAGMAYVFLGESMDTRGAFGMSLVIVGICMTVFGRQNSISIFKINKEDRRGYIFAIIAPICQSAGMILTKTGLGDYNPVSGMQIRAFTALIGFGLISLIYCRGKNITKAVKNREGIKYTAIGAFFAPFLGASLSLHALQLVNAGLVSTFVGLTPVLIMAPEILVFKKKLKPLEIAGAFFAVIGTGIFFLW